MGGRVAEELSKDHDAIYIYELIYALAIVYGPENVTSGASSDIQNATQTAQAMVKVCPFGSYHDGGGIIDFSCDSIGDFLNSDLYIMGTGTIL